MEEERLKYLEESISRYLEYLNTQEGLWVSVHLKMELGAFFRDFPEIGYYNNHYHAYCMAVKSNRYLHEKCVQCQKMVLKHRTQERFFCGSCYAGVKELVFFLFYRGERVGFLSVSGYAGEQRNTKEQTIAEFVSEKSSAAGFLGEPFFYEQLKKQEPPAALCRQLLPPLVICLEDLFAGWMQLPGRECQDENDRILAYMENHYTHLTLEEVAKVFHKSKSSISHAFKKKNGLTLKAYCNRLKLRDAAWLLKHTDLPVTQVALSAGFESLSYFISLFCEAYGDTPSRYRQG